MANWVRCTRKVDNEPIYLNLDTTEWLRWNETEKFTIVAWPGGKENIVRVLEHPDDIFTAARQRVKSLTEAAR